jgi:hypothetical protein
MTPKKLTTLAIIFVVVRVSTRQALPRANVKKPIYQHRAIPQQYLNVPEVVAMIVMLATLVNPRAVLLSQLPMNHTIPHQTATPAVSLTPSLSSGSGIKVGSVRMLDSALDIGLRADRDRLIPAREFRRERVGLSSWSNGSYALMISFMLTLEDELTH